MSAARAENGLFPEAAAILLGRPKSSARWPVWPLGCCIYVPDIKLGYFEFCEGIWTFFILGLYLFVIAGCNIATVSSFMD